MLQKRILEIFIFCLYWLCLIPLCYEYLMQKYFLLSYERIGQFAVATLFGYMCLHALAICVYLKCKAVQHEAYATMRKREEEEKADAEHKKHRKDLNFGKPKQKLKFGPIQIA